MAAGMHHALVSFIRSLPAAQPPVPRTKGLPAPPQRPDVTAPRALGPGNPNPGRGGGPLVCSWSAEQRHCRPRAGRALHAACRLRGPQHGRPF
eukprot:9131471-Lingulodinium_polyedra.AAC.1